MFNSSNKSIHLLKVIPYELNGAEISEIREDLRYNENSILEFALPKYTINKKTKVITYSDYYLQFAYNKEEKYLLFDIELGDNKDFLDIEIGEVGLEELFHNGGERDNEIFINIINHKIPLNRIKELRTSWVSKKISYIVIQINYVGHDDDWESYISLVGYLNTTMKLIEKNEIELL